MKEAIFIYDNEKLQNVKEIIKSSKGTKIACFIYLF